MLVGTASIGGQEQPWPEVFLQRPLPVLFEHLIDGQCRFTLAQTSFSYIDGKTREDKLPPLWLPRCCWSLEQRVQPSRVKLVAHSVGK